MIKNERELEQTQAKILICQALLANARRTLPPEAFRREAERRLEEWNRLDQAIRAYLTDLPADAASGSSWMAGSDLECRHWFPPSDPAITMAGHQTASPGGSARPPPQRSWRAWARWGSGCSPTGSRNTAARRLTSMAPVWRAPRWQ